MSADSKFQRFDPITVRAAARIVHMGASGRLTTWEVRYYLRELAAMLPRAGRGATRGLSRLAMRRAALGHTGAPGGSRLRRCSPSLPPAGEGAAAPDRRVILVEP